ncbi:hypothetical protein AB0C81_18715 [Streptomyces roseoverticillatus]|uniref:hypothetical protein n=1 Tax=Streptomyces roseoverticillatus TaxID=66429 RepID=UPI0033EEE7B5
MFAAVCVLLAALGHVLMSGIGVPWWAMSAAFVGTAAGAWFLASRERGPLTVIAATVAVQASLHSGFSLAQSVLHPCLPSGTSFARQWAAYLMCGGGTVSTLSAQDAQKVVNEAGLGSLVSQPPPGTVLADAGSHAHHAMHGIAGAASEATGTFMPPDGHDMAATSSAGMLAAHLLAALLLGLWLAYGEQGAFRFLRVVAGWLWTPLRLLFALAPAPLSPRIRLRRVRHSRALPQLFLVHAITSRGPPTGTAVL